MRILFLFTVALAFAGCHRLPLACRTEYLYPDFLASSRVLTPDPWRNYFYGEQVIVRWDLFAIAADEIRLHVRYGTREIETFSAPITRRHGYKIYRLVNDDYWCLEGIISYKAQLYYRGDLVTEWKHHLWAEIIELSQTTL